MTLTICGGTRMNGNNESTVSMESVMPAMAVMTTEYSVGNTPKLQHVMHSVQSAFGMDGAVDLSGLFREGAFSQNGKADEEIEYGEFTLAYLKLSESEDKRQALRDINIAMGGKLTTEVQQQILSNLSKHFDIHYVRHGGILIDFRIYDPFGDFCDTVDGTSYSQWQLGVFVDEDSQYEHGFTADDQEVFQSIMRFQCRGLV